MKTDIHPTYYPNAIGHLLVRQVVHDGIDQAGIAR